MSLEDEVKEAFTRRADDARADGQSWNAVEKKVRRAHRQRFVFTSALSLVIIAAIAIVVLKGPGTNQSRGFSNTSPTPTEATTPSPSLGPSTTPTAQPHPSSLPEGFKARVGVQSGFAVDIPKDWKGGWFEGYWDFEPAGLPSTAQGGDTFALVITLEPGSYTKAGGGAGTTELTIGGRKAYTWSTDPLHVVYSVDWPGCPKYVTTCTSSPEGERLIMRLSGSTQRLWDSYEALGRQAALTVHVYDGTAPEHGTVASGITNDEFTKALIRFLDARVEGIGADELMSSEAASQFSDTSGCPDLYQAKTSHRAWTGYDVSRREETAAKATFTVGMTTGDGQVYIETFVVGRSAPDQPAVIESRGSGCS